MPSATMSMNATKRTYFYVFVDTGAIGGPHPLDDLTVATPDYAVHRAFDRLRTQVPDTEVCINPSNALRCALGIESLPAFAVSDRELDVGTMPKDAPKLPSFWDVLRRGERQRMLASSKYIPTVERAIVELYKTPDSLYQLIRDIHFQQIDHGLIGARRKIEGEVRRLGGKKLMNAVVLLRRVSGV